MRSAPGRRMFGASAWSLSVTFSSLEASLFSVAASHCCRCPASYQVARHRPPSDRGGYTVIPHSSSMTSPPPRVDSRPVPAARTLARGGLLAVFARPTGRPGALRPGCEDFVGILTCAGAACVMALALFLLLSQVRGLTDGPGVCGQGRGRTADLPLFSSNALSAVRTCKNGRHRQAKPALGGRCKIHAPPRRASRPLPRPVLLRRRAPARPLRAHAHPAPALPGIRRRMGHRHLQGQHRPVQRIRTPPLPRRRDRDAGARDRRDLHPLCRPQNRELVPYQTTFALVVA